MKIVVDQETCIGAAACVAIAAKTFNLNGNGKVYILNEKVEGATKNADGDVTESELTEPMDPRETIIEAARSCPVMAIKLFEDSGEEIVL